MREIKFVTHISRNFYLYFLVFLLLKLVFNFQTSLQLFFLGLLAYGVGYAPVYFLNDSQDHKEDKADHKDNLYSAIGSPALFWIITFSLFAVGAYLGILVSTKGYILMLVCYILNFLHSFRPFRFKGNLMHYSANYFIMNLVKFGLMISYLHFTFTTSLIGLMLMFASGATLAGLIYKRHKHKNTIIEGIFGFIFLIASAISTYQYPKLLILLAPIVVLMVYANNKYKDKPLPANQFQLAMLIYSLVVFAIITFL